MKIRLGVFRLPLTIHLAIVSKRVKYVTSTIRAKLPIRTSLLQKYWLIVAHLTSQIQYYQLHQTNSSGANGFAEASRPLSATSGRSTNSNYRIRMNSVKRVNNKGVLRSNL
jgi:hypothetical protein